MTRTTQKELEGLVNRLNRVTGNPEKPWDNGKSNIGNYHLDYAYGGVKLVQTMNEGGGIRTITLGYETKRNCYLQIVSYLNGIEDCIRSSAEHDAKINAAIA